MARMAVVVVLSAAAFLLICGTLALGLLSGMLVRRIDRLEPVSRARLLFGLRVLPLAAAGAGALAVVLPTFLWFEPSGSHERIPVTLIVMALCGLALLARAAWRAVHALSVTRRLTQQWLAAARFIPGFDAPVAAYAIDDEFPTVAVVGIRRPVLFMSSRVLRECSADETRAMILHEHAHIEARDNARRLALRACPDLFTRAGQFDRAWESASEEAARIARLSAGALSLAQALIRIGRLVPDPLVGSVSAIYSGGSLDARVRRLVTPPSFTRSAPALSRMTIALAGALAVWAFAASAPAIHQAIEALVATLP